MPLGMSKLSISDFLTDVFNTCFSYRVKKRQYITRIILLQVFLKVEEALEKVADVLGDMRRSFLNSRRRKNLLRR